MSEHESHRAAGSSMGDLRARIEQLQRSVEQLSSGSDWSAPPEPEPPAPAPVQSPPYVPSEPPASPEPEMAPAAVPPPEVPPPTADAAPAATPMPPAPNGHVSAPADTVVEAGPFADLIDLHRFEDSLAALEGVADVRVRRFGHRMATIDVAMTGNSELAPELPRLNRPMQLARGAGGELVIELEPHPDSPLNGAGDGGGSGG